jgi:hypothetical protein
MVPSSNSRGYHSILVVPFCSRGYHSIQNLWYHFYFRNLPFCSCILPCWCTSSIESLLQQKLEIHPYRFPTFWQHLPTIRGIVFYLPRV